MLFQGNLMQSTRMTHALEDSQEVPNSPIHPCVSIDTHLVMQTATENDTDEIGDKQRLNHVLRRQCSSPSFGLFYTASMP